MLVFWKDDDGNAGNDGNDRNNGSDGGSAVLMMMIVLGVMQGFLKGWRKAKV